MKLGNTISSKNSTESFLSSKKINPSFASIFATKIEQKINLNLEALEKSQALKSLVLGNLEDKTVKVSKAKKPESIQNKIKEDLSNLLALKKDLDILHRDQSLEMDAHHCKPRDPETKRPMNPMQILCFSSVKHKRYSEKFKEQAEQCKALFGRHGLLKLFNKIALKINKKTFEEMSTITSKFYEDSKTLLGKRKEQTQMKTQIKKSQEMQNESEIDSEDSDIPDRIFIEAKEFEFDSKRFEGKLESSSNKDISCDIGQDIPVLNHNTNDGVILAGHDLSGDIKEN